MQKAYSSTGQVTGYSSSVSSQWNGLRLDKPRCHVPFNSLGHLFMHSVVK